MNKPHVEAIAIHYTILGNMEVFVSHNEKTEHGDKRFNGNKTLNDRAKPFKTKETVEAIEYAKELQKEFDVDIESSIEEELVFKGKNYNMTQGKKYKVKLDTDGTYISTDDFGVPVHIIRKSFKNITNIGGN